MFFWSVSLSLFGSVHFLIFKKSDSFFPSVTVNLPLLFKESLCVFWSVTLSLFGLVHYLTFKKSLVFFWSVCLSVTFWISPFLDLQKIRLLFSICHCQSATLQKIRLLFSSVTINLPLFKKSLCVFSVCHSVTF